MLRRMDSRELNEWMAFFGLEPWGTEVDFYGHAITASTVANANRGKGKKAAKVDEFMPKFGKRQKGQTMEEQMNIAKLLTQSLGGTVAEGSDG